MGVNRSLAERGVDWLHRKQRDHASRVVIYGRGEDRCQCNALIGQTEFETTAEGVPIISESRDFLILVDELALSTGKITPRRGDIIRERHGATTVEYEVNAIDGNRCFSRDRFRGRYRIHTKEIDS